MEFSDKAQGEGIPASQFSYSSVKSEWKPLTKPLAKPEESFEARIEKNTRSQEKQVDIYMQLNQNQTQTIVDQEMEYLGSVKESSQTLVEFNSEELMASQGPNVDIYQQFMESNNCSAVDQELDYVQSVKESAQMDNTLEKRVDSEDLTAIQNANVAIYQQLGQSTTSSSTLIDQEIEYLQSVKDSKDTFIETVSELQTPHVDLYQQFSKSSPNAIVDQELAYLSSVKESESVKAKPEDLISLQNTQVEMYQGFNQSNPKSVVDQEIDYLRSIKKSIKKIINDSNKQAREQESLEIVQFKVFLKQLLSTLNDPSKSAGNVLFD
jgi:hypothetical protein